MALTYEYINVSGPKPKLYNLSPSMTKPKDLKERREKPSGDTSAQLKNMMDLISNKMNSMLRENKTERERMEV